MNSEIKNDFDANLNRSYIYMLICRTTGIKYIGSTDLSIEIRFRLHKSHYKRYLNQKASYISSVEVFKKDNAHLILLEEVKSNNTNDVSEREAFYINSFNCINKNKPCKHLYSIDYKQYYKDYYIKNKDAFKNRKSKGSLKK